MNQKNKVKKSVIGGYICGGNMVDIPKPHIRMFDDKRLKRKVSLTITQYTGIGSHYYITLKEQNNSILDTKDNKWRLCWGDDLGVGKRVESKVDTEEEIKKEVNYLFEENFNKKTHRIVNKQYYKKWFYKEGD